MINLARDAARRGTGKPEGQTRDRFVFTLVIAASIIAAMRLAREPEIGGRSPRLLTAVAYSVTLARMIMDRIVR